jgi:hypothetical protein
MRRWRELCATLAAVGLGGALFVACANGASTSATPWSDGGGGSGDATTDAGPEEASTSDGSAGDGTTGMKDTGTTPVDSGSGGNEDGSADADAGCAAPTTLCVDVCVDLQTNPFNCGTCGHFCTTGLVCSMGQCVPNCPPGQSLCSSDGGLVESGTWAIPDAAADADTDGAADTDAAVDGGEASGLYCATLPSDPNNCNGCGIVCPVGHDTPNCVKGVCGIGQCDPGFTDCDNITQNGCETNTGKDPNNCGSCGNVCNEPNAVAGCAGGKCTVGMCDPGFADCNNNPSDGCEINTNTNNNDCGTCGTICNLPNTASDVCTAGMCEIGTCAAGWADCNKNPADGCETNINTSNGNCGSCGAVCAPANASPVCSNGMCAIQSCNPGFADCDSNPGDGCEVNTNTNPNDCGGCGLQCALPNAVAGCSNAKCAVAACSAGFADCDGNPTNGCETSTATNPNDCGGCGAVCSLPEATAGCAGGMCTVAACAAGHQDCDHVASDGCEVDTNNDPNNCGGCNHQCFVPNGVAGCSGGNCTIASCNGPYKDCNGNVADGCEDNVTNDNNNCGACGNACFSACGGSNDHVASTQCVGSTCSVVSCDAPYNNFDGQCTNGCECNASATQNACNNAISLFSGVLQPNQSITPYVANMGATGVTQAWFTLSFGGNTLNSFHPQISITSMNNEFVMDIEDNCSGTSVNSCSDGSPVGVATWEVYNTDTNSPIGTPEPLPGNAGQVWIRVYRRTGAVATCDNYTITASN